MELSTEEEALWLHNRFFLSEEQLKAPPAWLEDYKKGIEKFFQDNSAGASRYFHAALQAGCPATVYVWLISLNPHLISDAQVDYKDKITPSILEQWAASPLAEEQNSAAYCYYYGVGANKSDERAISLYEQAAQQGYAIAQINLAHYWLGQQNLANALKYLQAAAAQGLPSAKENLAFLQTRLHSQRTQMAGNWLLYTLGLLPMLLAVGFGGLAAYLGSLWFANFGHIFAGTFLTAGVVGCVGALVWLIGSVIGFGHEVLDFELTKMAADVNNPSRNYNFLNYMFEGLLRHSLKLVLFVISLAIILIIMQTTDLTAILSHGFLSGLTSLAGIPGLDFLSPLLTSAFAQGVVETFCVLSPLILYGAGNCVVETFRPAPQGFVGKDPIETQKLDEEDEESGERKDLTIMSDEELNEIPVNQTTQAVGSYEIPVVAYAYTEQQKEYMKNKTGRYLVRALHEFIPESSDQYQLTFKQGDLIWVLDSHPEEDWWIGEMHDSGENGYFPVNYVEILKPAVKKSDSAITPKYEAGRSQSL